MRIDVLLVQKSIAESRNKAQEMICSGLIYCDGRLITKPSFDADERCKIEIRGETMKFVGRGGLKLEGALDRFGISVNGLICADIGASTGGFTDCLLQRGAAKVYAIDSGRGQLHEKIKSDDRVISYEGFNARELTEAQTNGKVDLVVMDVSFISQSLLYGAVCKILKPGGMFVSLIKPQFEAGRSHVGKNGIVKDKKVHRAVIDKLSADAKGRGLIMTGVAESSVKGGDGNTEYTAYFILKS